MCASRAVARRVRELVEAARPAITEMIEKNDPSVEGLEFCHIEANSAAAGDLLARLMMEQAVSIQPEPTAEEVERVRRRAQLVEGLPLNDPNVEGVRAHRKGRKRRRIKTIRGEIEIEREHVHFPDLGSGLSPGSREPADPLLSRTCGPLDLRLDLPDNEISARAEKSLLQQIAVLPYRRAVEVTELFGWSLSQAQAGRVTARR